MSSTVLVGPGILIRGRGDRTVHHIRPPIAVVAAKTTTREEIMMFTIRRIQLSPAPLAPSGQAKRRPMESPEQRPIQCSSEDIRAIAFTHVSATRILAVGEPSDTKIAASSQPIAVSTNTPPFTGGRIVSSAVRHRSNMPSTRRTLPASRACGCRAVAVHHELHIDAAARTPGKWLQPLRSRSPCVAKSTRAPCGLRLSGNNSSRLRAR